MAETNNHEEPTLPSKRKLDQEPHDLPTKTPKITTSDLNGSANSASEPNAVINKENDNDPQNDYVNNEPENDTVNDADEEEDDEDEDSDAERVVDRKGKGILREDKGKGKLIEEDEEDDDEDDDDDSDDSDDDSDGNFSGSDSDFSDDPLAEVDLNNILPARTRRQTTRPAGVRIGGSAPNAGQGKDDSDDSDA